MQGSFFKQIEQPGVFSGIILKNQSVRGRKHAVKNQGHIFPTCYFALQKALWTTKTHFTWPMI